MNGCCERTCALFGRGRSEEHTSELQSRSDLVCRLLLEKKKIAPAHFLAAGGAGIAHPAWPSSLRCARRQLRGLDALRLTRSDPETCGRAVRLSTARRLD